MKMRWANSLREDRTAESDVKTRWLGAWCELVTVDKARHDESISAELHARFHAPANNWIRNNTKTDATWPGRLYITPHPCPLQITGTYSWTSKAKLLKFVHFRLLRFLIIVLIIAFTFSFYPRGKPQYRPTDNHASKQVNLG